MENFINKLKEQSQISIVGNAESIFDKQNGELIDNGLVIRLNKALVTNTISQGSKFDVLVTGQDVAATYWGKTKSIFTEIITFPGSYGERRINRCLKQKNVPILVFPDNCWRSLISLTPKTKILYEKMKFNSRKQKISSRMVSRVQWPSTGFSILYFMNYYEIKNVYIFGFDWKATKSIQNIEMTSGPHNFIWEKELISEWVEKNDWKVL